MVASHHLHHDDVFGHQIIHYNERVTSLSFLIFRNESLHVSGHSFRWKLNLNSLCNQMQNLETAEGCQWLKSWYVEQSLHGNGNICEREGE